MTLNTLFASRPVMSKPHPTTVVELSLDGPCPVIRATGQLDAVGVTQLSDCCRDAHALSAPLVVLDLQSVTFIGSSSLGVLVGFVQHMHARGHTVRALPFSAPMTRAVNMVKLASLVEHFATLDDAVANVNRLGD